MKSTIDRSMIRISVLLLSLLTSQQSMADDACATGSSSDIEASLQEQGLDFESSSQLSYQGNCTNSPGCNERFELYMEANASISLSTCTGTSFDTGIVVKDDQDRQFCSDDACGFQSNLEFTAEDSGIHEFYINGFATESGTYQLDITTDGIVDYVCSAADRELIERPMRCPTSGTGINPNIQPFMFVENIGGTWFNPDRDGEGFIFEGLDECPEGFEEAAGCVLVYWFTFPPPDSPSIQTWIIGIGQLSGSGVIVPEALITSGGVFGPLYDPDAIERSVWGSITVVFAGFDITNSTIPGTASAPATGTVTYSGPAEFGDGTTEIQKLVRVGGSNSGLDGLGGGISGTWFDPSHDGEGWIIQRTGTRAIVYWFTYDDQSRQAWNIGEGEIRNNQIIVSQALETSGTRFGEFFVSQDVERAPWGSYVMTFDSCNSGTVSYGNNNGLGFGDFDIVRLTAPFNFSCGDILEQPESLQIRASSNSVDPLFLTAFAGDGVVIDVFTNPSPENSPDLISSILVTDSLGQRAVIGTDGQDRPDRIISDAGTNLTLQYSDTSQAAALLSVTADGSRSSLVGLSPTSTELASQAVSSLVANKNQKSSSGVVIDILACSQPLDHAHVEVLVETGSDVFVVPASSLGGGRYEALVPFQNQQVDAFEICESYVESSTDGCAIVNGIEDTQIPSICRAAAERLAVDSSQATDDTAMAVAHIEECVSVLFKSARACDLAGGNLPVSERSDFVCGNILKTFNRNLSNLAADTNFTVNVRLPGTDFSQTQTAQANSAGPFPDFSFAFSEAPFLVDLSTSPEVPVVGENYTVTARFACVGPETNIALTQSRDSGATISTECATGEECSIEIPGPTDAGNIDSISVSIDSNQARLFRVDTSIPQ